MGLSGGKDSIVSLELCAQHFARVEAFYMYHVEGLACIERSVDSAAARFGVKVVHKVPHPDVARSIRDSELRPHNHDAPQVKCIKQLDIEKALTKKTGISWFAYGERACDSFARRLYTRKNDGIREDWKRVFPIWDWRHDEVVSYLKQKKIPLPERFGAGEYAMSGFALAPWPLYWLKENEPRDFERVLKVFPYAEAMVMRHEQWIRRQRSKPQEPAPERKPKRKRDKRARGAHKVSEVQDGAGAQEGLAQRALQPAQDR